MSGSRDKVVEWLVQHRAGLYDSTLFDTSNIASLYEYVSTAIDSAARNGNMQLLQKILDVKHSFKFPNDAMDNVVARACGKMGHTLCLKNSPQFLLVALREAVRHDHSHTAMDIFSMLDFSTPNLMIFYACKDRLRILELLYEKTSASDWNVSWKCEYPTLLYLAAKAAYYGHEDVASLLLDQSSIELQVKDILGRTPLHYASGQGHLSVVLQLLQKLGPLEDDVICDDNGMSPLQLAICAGHALVVRELLLNRVGCSTDYRRKAKDYTSQNLESLFNFQNLPCPLGCKREFGRHDIEEFYESPNLIDSVFWSPGGFTSLHFAAALLHSEVLQQLLIFYCHQELDDVLLLKDSMGFTAYEWAHARGLGHFFLKCVEASKGKEFFAEFTKKVGSIEEMNQAAVLLDNLLKEIDRFEQSKREMKWCMGICQALHEHDMVVARRSVYEAESRKLNIACFGQSISQALIWHIFPRIRSLDPLSVASSLPEKCMIDGMSRKDREGLMIHLCQVAEFTSTVLERWLQLAIVFGFHDLAYHLIVRVKINRKSAIDISYLIESGEGIPLDGLLSPFKLAVMLKQPRMQRWMTERDDVKRGLYEDRQVYVDYANTILVGAVLIAGVAYQGWLQPPSGFDEDGYSCDSSTLQVFWWLNSSSFFLSVATVIAAGVGAMPTSNNEHLVDAVSRVHSAVSVASILFPMSMVCIMAAFAAAGLTILPHPMHTYQPIMKMT